MKKKKTISLFLSGLLTATFLFSCATPTNNNINGTEIESILDKDINKENFIKNYSNIVYNTYLDSLNKAKEMQKEIKSFIDNPSEESFEKAKKSWLDARIPYSQSEAFRFYAGPIDDEKEVESRINSWPLDEVYIDYVEGSPNSGIINDTVKYPKIDTQLLEDLNVKDGDKNISVGYHAIEFLLWGQDLVDGEGGGKRAYTDYLKVNGTNQNQDRRALYLNTVTDLLVSDLEYLVEQWDTNKKDNYYQKFKNLPVDDALSKILRGIGTLSSSELSTERMATPLDIGEREEEQSCFSDNTSNDILYNQKGIKNIIDGKYKNIDGKEISGVGLYHLINKEDPSIGNKLKEVSNECISLIENIKSPFELEIKPGNKEGNKRVLDAVNKLQEEGKVIVEVGKAFGITINTEL